MTTLAAPTLTEDRAAALLGAGIPAETVAASLGVSPARISQLLSDDAFAARVAELRFASLQKHNARDASYDGIEDALLERLEKTLPLMHKPMEILKAIQVINGAKRRGTSTPDSIIEKQQVMHLTIPIQIVNKFATNLQGQVTSVSDGVKEQSLVTIQSGSLDSLLKEKGHEIKSNGAARIPGNVAASS